MIKAILFDIDGTLLDTSEFILQAFEHSLQHQGIKEVERHHIIEKLGPSLRDMYLTLSPNADQELFVRTHRDFQNENLHLSKPFPETHMVLAKLKEKGIKIGAVTARSNENSIKTLELAGIKDFFEIIISFEDVKVTKPDPEGVFKALEYMEVKPHEAIMVGDTHVDVEAGKNAGTITVGITHGMKGDLVKNSFPDYVIGSLPELLEIIE